MTPLELRQLLYLYTQPDMTKSKAQLAADTLRKLGLIETAPATSELPAVLTQRGRQYVKALMLHLDENPLVLAPQPERMNNWLLLQEGTTRRWVIDSSELETRVYSAMLGHKQRQMLSPYAWMPDIRSNTECQVTLDPDGDIVKWLCPSEDKDGPCELVIFND